MCFDMFKATLSPVRLTGGIHGRSSTKIKVTYDDRLLGRIFLGGTVRVVRVNRLLPQANYYFSCRKKILVNIYTRTPHTAMPTHTHAPNASLSTSTFTRFSRRFTIWPIFFQEIAFHREKREREREKKKKNPH